MSKRANDVLTHAAQQIAVELTAEQRAAIQRLASETPAEREERIRRTVERLRRASQQG